MQALKAHLGILNEQQMHHNLTTEEREYDFGWLHAATDTMIAAADPNEVSIDKKQELVLKRMLNPPVSKRGFSEHRRTPADIALCDYVHKSYNDGQSPPLQELLFQLGNKLRFQYGIYDNPIGGGGPEL